MTTAMPDTLTAVQVAEKAGVTRMTVNRWVYEGLLQPIKKPNPLLRRQSPFRFRREEVERFLEPLYRAS